jgi:hypothetical protein
LRENKDYITCAGDCADIDILGGNTCDVHVDHFWANFGPQDRVAMPLLAAKGEVNKGNKPSRRVAFNDQPDVRTHVVDDLLFTRQTPSSSFLECKLVGYKIVVDEDYLYLSDHSSAVARYKALDLLGAWAVDGRKVLPLIVRIRDLECLGSKL